ncbi:MAG: hypothetical protein RLZZ605_122 [Bacteroidota bacterium]|jgi:hypothetical protein
MKKQFLKIAMFCLLSLSWSIGAIAQHYEGGTSENVYEETINNSVDNTMPANTIQGAAMMNQQATSSNNYQHDEETHFSGSIAYPGSNGTRSSDGDNGSALGGIPDPAPDTPIDSNLYVLLFAALCYGVYQRKRLIRLEVRG